MIGSPGTEHTPPSSSQFLSPFSWHRKEGALGFFRQLAIPGGWTEAVLTERTETMIAELEALRESRIALQQYDQADTRERCAEVPDYLKDHGSNARFKKIPELARQILHLFIRRIADRKPDRVTLLTEHSAFTSTIAKSRMHGWRASPVTWEHSSGFVQTGPDDQSHLIVTWDQIMELEAVLEMHITRCRQRLGNAQPVGAS